MSEPTLSDALQEIRLLKHRVRILEYSLKRAVDLRKLGRPGELNASARVTAEMVVEIRAKRAAGLLVKQLAHEYGLSATAIYEICNGRTWKHVTGGQPVGKDRRRKGGKDASPDA